MLNYAEKYAICSLCKNMRKMRQSAKYAAIAYSRFSDMPKYSPTGTVVVRVNVL